MVCQQCGRPGENPCLEDKIVQGVTQLVIKWQLKGRNAPSMIEDLRNFLQEVKSNVPSVPPVRKEHSQKWRTSVYGLQETASSQSD
jgi:hypothetical protein